MSGEGPGVSRAARGLLLALACAALSGCRPEAPQPAVSASPVLVKRATSHTVTDRIEATGQLIAQAEATVAAQVSGEVTGIAADEGAAVEQGELIVAIDPLRRELELENARASVVQAEAQLAEAGREAGRIEKLAGRGAASQSRVDQTRTERELARSQLVAARARLGLAERALADASVAAPFAGLIARRHVNVGEFVNAGEPLFDLVALDPVEVEFHLAEVDSSRAAVGQAVEVRVASYPDAVFDAEVSVVSPTIDSRTRTRRVKALLANPEGRLLPGTFARVDLGVAERKGVVMIPKEALLQRADGAVLFRLVGVDRVERVRVETGIHRGEFVEIRDEVAPEDWIVVRGQSRLIDGSAVSLRDEDGAALSAAALDSVTGGRGG